MLIKIFLVIVRCLVAGALNCIAYVKIDNALVHIRGKKLESEPRKILRKKVKEALHSATLHCSTVKLPLQNNTLFWEAFKNFIAP